MKKYKSSIFLCLTVCVLIFCGMLPAITAKIGDSLTDETVSYEKMKTVQFFRELNDMEKIFLLKNGSSIIIPKERSKLKTENVMEILESVLKVFCDIGMIQGNIHDFSISGEPLRYYSSTESNLSATIWTIRMELLDDLGQSISLYLDDQQGKILLISYECLEPVYDTDMLSKYVNRLVDYYFSNMDWSMAAYEDYIGEENTEMYHSETLVYRVGDLIYGEIGIKFTVSESGFRIYLE